jgi:hypothetical protein
VLTAGFAFRALFAAAIPQGVFVSADTWRNLRRQLDVKLEDSHILVHEHNKARRLHSLRARTMRPCLPPQNSLP